MNLPAKLAHRFASNVYVTSLSLLASFISFGIVMRGVWAGVTPSTGAIVILIITVLLFAVTHFYSLKIRIDNQNLEEIAKYFRMINSAYRENLHNTFWNSGNSYSLDDRLRTEKETLRGVCQLISRIYSRLLYGKECTTTVKLLTEDEDNISFATQYVRSRNFSERDENDLEKYEVNTGRNTGLDEALKVRPNGKLSYFHSADLSKEVGYENQRSNYNRWYKSAIIVPIRCPSKRGERNTRTYGILAVDTMTRHRLNNTHHIEMLTALSEQMFNFMALMRGDYQIQSESEQ